MGRRDAYEEPYTPFGTGEVREEGSSRTGEREPPGCRRSKRSGGMKGNKKPKPREKAAGCTRIPLAPFATLRTDRPRSLARSFAQPSYSEPIETSAHWRHTAICRTRAAPRRFLDQPHSLGSDERRVEAFGCDFLSFTSAEGYVFAPSCKGDFVRKLSL